MKTLRCFCEHVIFVHRAPTRGEKKSGFSFMQLQKKKKIGPALRFTQLNLEEKGGGKGDFRRSTLGGHCAKFRRKRDSNLASRHKVEGKVVQVKDYLITLQLDILAEHSCHPRC